jgi:hypothetical protein
MSRTDLQWASTARDRAPSAGRMWPPSPPEETRATKTAHEGRVLRDELVSLLRQRGLQVWGHPPTEAGRGQAAQDLGVSDAFSQAWLAPRSCCVVPSRPLHRHAPSPRGPAVLAVTRPPDLPARRRTWRQRSSCIRRAVLGPLVPPTHLAGSERDCSWHGPSPARRDLSGVQWSRRTTSRPGPARAVACEGILRGP